MDPWRQRKHSPVRGRTGLGNLSCRINMIHFSSTIGGSDQAQLSMRAFVGVPMPWLYEVGRISPRMVTAWGEWWEESTRTCPMNSKRPQDHVVSDAQNS